MPWEQAFWLDAFENIQTNLSTWVPSVFSALLLVLVGWIVARLSQALIGRLLEKLGLNRLADRTGISQALLSVGVQSGLSFFLARVAYWLILIFFLLLALGALGLSDVVTTALNSFFVFLPKLVVAMAIFLVGAFIARLTGDAVSTVAERSNVATGRVLGQAVRYSILLVVVVLALDELGVQTTILITIIIVAIAVVGLTIALSFGLGNRELAHSIMAGFHAREEFRPGQMLTIGKYSGKLVRIGATKTQLETSDGQISIPNVSLLTDVVLSQPGEENDVEKYAEVEGEMHEEDRE